MDDNELSIRVPTGARATLLLSKRPLLVPVELAAIIGLEEAIVLQQLQYWLDGSTHEHDGRRWIYNTLGEWQAQFPFWTERVLQRIMKSLVARGLVVVHRFNKANWDRTNWYAIEYEEVEKLADECKNVYRSSEEKRIEIATRRKARKGFPMG